MKYYNDREIDNIPTPVKVLSSIIRKVRISRECCVCKQVINAGEFAIVVTMIDTELSKRKQKPFHSYQHSNLLTCKKFLEMEK